MNKTAGLLSLVFFAVGGVLMFQTFDYLQGAEKLDAVISHVDVRRAKGSNSYATVSFKVGGQSQTAQVPVNFRTSHQGDRVSIYYNPTETPPVKLGKFSSIWLFPGGFLAAALVCLVMMFKKQE